MMRGISIPLTETALSMFKKPLIPLQISFLTGKRFVIPISHLTTWGELRREITEKIYGVISAENMRLICDGKQFSDENEELVVKSLPDLSRKGYLTVHCALRTIEPKVESPSKCMVM